MKLLYNTLVGSRLYGISGPDSDWDYKGFSLPNLDELIGLKSWNQSVEKTENTETTIYALKKYLEYCTKGNPTVLEVSFAHKNYVQYINPLGEQIISFVRKHCISKRVFLSYNAYCRAQTRKLQRPNREGKRQVLIDKFGFDPKFSAHAIRLSIQAIELCKYGYIFPTMSRGARKLCLKVRNGEVSKEKVLEYLVKLDEDMYTAYKNCSLPDLPDFNLINDFLTEVQSNYIRGKYVGIL